MIKILSEFDFNFSFCINQSIDLISSLLIICEHCKLWFTQFYTNPKSNYRNDTRAWFLVKWNVWTSTFPIENDYNLKDVHQIINFPFINIEIEAVRYQASCISNLESIHCMKREQIEHHHRNENRSHTYTRTLSIVQRFSFIRFDQIDFISLNWTCDSIGEDVQTKRQYHHQMRNRFLWVFPLSQRSIPLF